MDWVAAVRVVEVTEGARVAALMAAEMVLVETVAGTVALVTAADWVARARAVD